jgi:hypothetical protein
LGPLGKRLKHIELGSRPALNDHKQLCTNATKNNSNAIPNGTTTPSNNLSIGVNGAIHDDDDDVDYQQQYIITSGQKHDIISASGSQ